MILRKIASVFAIAAIALALAPHIASAQATDSVTVTDQAIQAGTVVVAQVVAKAPGWIVIHATSDGAPVIGETYVHAGENDNVAVSIDMDQATPQLLAMLHVDAGKLGVYEFPGADAPVNGADGKVIAPPFKVIGVDVDDQLIDGGKVTVGKIIAQQDGWIAIHTSAQGLPVIGSAPIKAGVNEDVEVTIDASKATDKMSAMIHIDAGKIGTYEFPGADAPATYNKAITNEPFWTTDHVRVVPQMVGSDNTAVIPYIMAKQDGWIVLHSSAQGNPAIGHAAVKKGLNEGVKITIDDPKTITPVVLVMLHIDAGKIGTYEFPGADAPVFDANKNVVAPPMLIAEGVLVHDQAAADITKAGSVWVDQIVAAKDGWIVIHSGASGFPAIGHAYVPAGASWNVSVPVKGTDVTPMISAMLHIDAGTLGVYEFPGADAPVMGSDGKPINPPINTAAAK